MLQVDIFFYIVINYLINLYWKPWFI